MRTGNLLHIVYFAFEIDGFKDPISNKSRNLTKLA
jgi:hypothetical protein